MSGYDGELGGDRRDGFEVIVGGGRLSRKFPPAPLFKAFQAGLTAFGGEAGEKWISGRETLALGHPFLIR